MWGKLGCLKLIGHPLHDRNCCRNFWQHYGDPLFLNVRRRGFTRFCKIFAMIQSLRVGSKIDFSCIQVKFHPKSILRNENKFFTPRGGLVGHFGLLLGFTPNRRGSRQKEISEQAHFLPCQTEKSKTQISAKKYRKQNLIFEIVAENCDR